VSGIDNQAAFLETILVAYPDLNIRSAHLQAGDGQFNNILIVNNNLVFRFPRYAESIPGFLREVQLLTRLQGHLPLSIPNPLYTGLGGAALGQIFMGYRLIPGRPLYRAVLDGITDASTLKGFACQLADFLSALHRLTPAMLGLGLPPQDMSTQMSSFFDEVSRQLFPLMRLDARRSLTAHFEQYFNAPDLQSYQPAIIHGDFGGSNILFEADGISGIIDFGFAAFSDPAVDLAALSTFGERFFDLICQSYPVDASMLERVKFYRGTFALYEALHGFKNKDMEAFESGMEQYI
jgi:aminoglycoside 2''-phosphotransferase